MNHNGGATKLEHNLSAWGKGLAGQCFLRTDKLDLNLSLVLVVGTLRNVLWSFALLGDVQILFLVQKCLGDVQLFMPRSRVVQGRVPAKSIHPQTATNTQTRACDLDASCYCAQVLVFIVS